MNTNYSPEDPYLNNPTPITRRSYWRQGDGTQIYPVFEGQLMNRSRSPNPFEVMNYTPYPQSHPQPDLDFHSPNSYGYRPYDNNEWNWRATNHRALLPTPDHRENVFSRIGTRAGGRSIRGSRRGRGGISVTVSQDPLTSESYERGANSGERPSRDLSDHYSRDYSRGNPTRRARSWKQQFPRGRGQIRPKYDAKREIMSPDSTDYVEYDEYISNAQSPNYWDGMAGRNSKEESPGQDSFRSRRGSRGASSSYNQSSKRSRPTASDFFEESKQGQNQPLKYSVANPSPEPSSSPFNVTKHPSDKLEIPNKKLKLTNTATESELQPFSKPGVDTAANSSETKDDLKLPELEHDKSKDELSAAVNDNVVVGESTGEEKDSDPVLPIPKPNDVQITSVVLAKVAKTKEEAFMSSVTSIDEELGIGFVGLDMIYSASAIVGKKPKVGDMVFVQAIRVEGMPYNFKCKIVQLVASTGEQDESESTTATISNQIMELAKLERGTPPSQQHSQQVAEAPIPGTSSQEYDPENPGIKSVDSFKLENSKSESKVNPIPMHKKPTPLIELDTESSSSSFGEAMETTSSSQVVSFQLQSLLNNDTLENVSTREIETSPSNTIRPIPQISPNIFDDPTVPTAPNTSDSDSRPVELDLQKIYNSPTKEGRGVKFVEYHVPELGHPVLIPIPQEEGDSETSDSDGMEGAAADDRGSPLDLSVHPHQGYQSTESTNNMHEFQFQQESNSIGSPPTPANTHGILDTLSVPEDNAGISPVSEENYENLDTSVPSENSAITNNPPDLPEEKVGIPQTTPISELQIKVEPMLEIFMTKDTFPGGMRQIKVEPKLEDDTSGEENNVSPQAPLVQMKPTDNPVENPITTDITSTPIEEEAITHPEQLNQSNPHSHSKSKSEPAQKTNPEPSKSLDKLNTSLSDASEEGTIEEHVPEGDNDNQSNTQMPSSTNEPEPADNYQSENYTSNTSTRKRQLGETRHHEYPKRNKPMTGSSGFDYGRLTQTKPKSHHGNEYWSINPDTDMISTRSQSQRDTYLDYDAVDIDNPVEPAVEDEDNDPEMRAFRSLQVRLSWMSDDRVVSGRRGFEGRVGYQEEYSGYNYNHQGQEGRRGRRERTWHTYEPCQNCGRRHKDPCWYA